MNELSSKCAVITGAASGLGFALARAALDHNMNVVISDVDASALKNAAAKLTNDHDRLVSVVADVADPQQVESLCDAAKRRYGGADLLINNAGRMINKFVWEHTPDDWQSILGVNIAGVTNALSIFVPEIIKRGSPAHIVNIGSIASFLPSPLMSSYTVSKFSVLAITETLKYELDMLEHQINVSLVAPGPLDTSIFLPSHEPTDKSGVSEHGEQLRQGMANATKAIGMKPDEAASIIFNGIKEDKFWIFTHPQTLEGLGDRAQSILDCDTPVYEDPTLEG